MRPINKVEDDIHSWIRGQSTVNFNPYIESGRIWVLKYFSPKYLRSFLQFRQLNISNTPGFTWGDGVYVVPLVHHYSTMMYGRVGVMGYIDARTIKAYDATEMRGLELYQEWIVHHPALFRRLSTTIHSDLANQILRTGFKNKFDIDIVYFRPDQHNSAYVSPNQDVWLVVSDFNTARRIGGGGRHFSNKILDCEWVVVVGEEFDVSESRMRFRDLMGRHITPYGARSVSNKPSLLYDLRHTYNLNRMRISPSDPPHLLYLRP